MKILYDDQIFTMQKIGGISRYFYELARNSVAMGHDVKISVANTENEYLLSDKNFSVPKSNYWHFENFLPGINFRGKGRIFNIFSSAFHKNYNDFVCTNRKYSVNLLKSQNFDVFHPTYYEPYFLEHIGNKPFVLTIHDMIHEKFPEFFSLNDTTHVYKKLLAEKAAKIIAISECTKSDIIDFLHVPEKKISVIYHGFSLSDIKNENDGNQISEKISDAVKQKYFLFTGTRDNYKNFYFFIQACANVLKQNPDLFIYCTAKEFSDMEIKFFKSLGIENRVRHFFASDVELRTLYENALAFVFPSYYEGFGMPVLEAFSARCPVVLARASCFYEIAGDGALYFDAKNMNELELCLQKILTDADLCESLKQKGVEQLKKYSVKETCQKTFNVYKDVLQRDDSRFVTDQKNTGGGV